MHQQIKWSRLDYISGPSDNFRHHKKSSNEFPESQHFSRKTQKFQFAVISKKRYKIQKRKRYQYKTKTNTYGGFQIIVYKLWLRFKDTVFWYDLPRWPSHAWEICRRTCSFNINCTSFDYCSSVETNSNEVFGCDMKSNTLAEVVIQTPEYCVKSVKQTCHHI